MSAERSNQPEDVVTEQSTIGAQLSEPAAVNRRRLFVGGGVAAMVAALTACGSEETTPGTAPTGGSSSSDSGGDMSGDLAAADLAAGLEALAVATYKAALDAAVAGKLGAVPPAVAEYVKTAMAHHQVHLDAWNKVIEGAGRPQVTEPNATLKPTVDAAFAKVTDAVGAANLALMLEEIAAQTYLKAMPTLKSKDAIKLAGQMQIIDQQHQAILRYVLGMYPVPDIFQPTDKAATA